MIVSGGIIGFSKYIMFVFGIIFSELHRHESKKIIRTIGIFFQKVNLMRIAIIFIEMKLPHYIHFQKLGAQCNKVLTSCKQYVIDRH